MNLVVNARDAMPMGGEVVIETEYCALPDGLHRDKATLPPGDYAVIRVRDEGVGMAPATLAKVFDPFFSTKRPGRRDRSWAVDRLRHRQAVGRFHLCRQRRRAGHNLFHYFAAQAAPSDSAPRHRNAAVRQRCRRAAQHGPVGRRRGAGPLFRGAGLAAAGPSTCSKPSRAKPRWTMLERPERSRPVRDRCHHAGPGRAGLGDERFVDRPDTPMCSCPATPRTAASPRRRASAARCLWASRSRWPSSAQVVNAQVRADTSRMSAPTGAKGIATLAQTLNPRRHFREGAMMTSNPQRLARPRSRLSSTTRPSRPGRWAGSRRWPRRSHGSATP